MKKVVSFTIVLISIVVFEACDPSASHVDTVGVLKLGSQKEILGYRWGGVDTLSGFTTLPLGFNALSSDYSQEIDTMVVAFQKRFSLRVINYTIFRPGGAGELSSVSSLITIFYKPLLDPQIEKFEKQLALHEIAQQQIKKQNKELLSKVNRLAMSNRQIKKQLKELKALGEKKE